MYHFLVAFSPTLSFLIKQMHLKLKLFPDHHLIHYVLLEMITIGDIAPIKNLAGFIVSKNL